MKREWSAIFLPFCFAERKVKRNRRERRERGERRNKNMKRRGAEAQRIDTRRLHGKLFVSAPLRLCVTFSLRSQRSLR